MSQILDAIAKNREQKISLEQQSIRQYFDKFNSPYYYISYSDFCKNMDVNAAKNYTAQNLHIIDIHLKYRQWIYQQMAPYKWTPILLISVFNLIRLRRPPLLIPFIYTQMFDHYMYPFFMWLHKDDKVINMRYEFVTKLSKTKNKERRVKLFKNLEKSLKREDQLGKRDQNTQDKSIQNKQQPKIPYKYLKFGFPSQYVFHGMSTNVQMSSVLQTNFFQNYIRYRYPSLSCFQQVFNNLVQLKDKFRQYKASGQKQKILTNYQQLMKFKDVKQQQQYQLTTQIQKRIRRWLETYMYDKTRQIYQSNWTVDKLFYTYEHKHLTQQPKYNIEANAPDLMIYYSLILVPTLLLKFFKR